MTCDRSHKNDSPTNPIVPVGLRGPVVDTGEQKCAGEELRQAAADQKLIADTALEISECKDDDAVCRILGEKAHGYNPGAIVAVSLYDPDLDAIRFRHYFGVDSSVERAIALMGRDPRQMPFPPQAMTEAERASRTSGKLELIADGIYELAMRKFPKIACDAVEKMLGIERVYNIGFGLDGMPYGGLIIMLRKGQPVRGQLVLETLVRHGAEVIKQRQAEKKLQENQRFLSTLISNLPGMVYRCHDDCDWTMEYASDGCLALTGYHPEDLVGSRRVTYEQIIHPDDRVHVRDDIRRALGRDEPFKITYRIRTAAGQERWVWEQGRKISGTGGEVMLEGFVTDITDQKQADDQLRQSRASMARAEAIAHVGHWEWDIGTGKLQWSDESCRIFGIVPGEIEVTGDLFVGMLHPDDRRRVLDTMGASTHRNVPFSIDFRVIRRDGSLRYVHAECEMALDDAGRPAKLFGIQQDVTDRKQAEASLIDKQRELQSFIDSLPGYAYTKERDGRVLMANRKFCDDFGFAYGEPIGKSNQDMFPPDLAQKYTADDETVMRTGEPLYTEDEGIVKGERLIYATRKIPLRDAGGRVMGMMGLTFDVSELKRTERALRESEASLTRAEQMAHLGNWTYDLKNDIMRASAEACRIYQVDPAQGPSIERFLQRTHPDDRTILERSIQDAILTGKPAAFNFRLCLPDGSERYVHCEAATRYDAAGEPLEMFGITQDITELRRTEGELYKLSRVVEQSPSGVVIAKVDGTIVYANPAMSRKTGFAAGELIGKQGSFIWGHTGKPEEIRGVFDRINAGEAWIGEHEYVRKDGGRGWSSLLLSPIKDDGGHTIAVAAIVSDITERMQAEARIKASLAEKEVLLKEVHHRVKNNLQVISSLLSLQASNIGDPGTRQILEDSQHRIRTIALVHEKIYGSEDLAIIDFMEYARNLTTYLQHSYSGIAGRVGLSVEGDPIKLGATVAVPLGLILNELISNCYKHAFRDGRAGTIAVTLAGGERPSISVMDDGAGLPPGFDPRSAGSMGMQLVCTLVDQIEGEIAVDSAQGTKFTITFRQDA